MKVNLVVALALAGGLPAFGQTLPIRLYDLAEVPPQALARAMELASGILRSAGVGTVWHQMSPDEPEAHTVDMSSLAGSRFLAADSRAYLAVRIVRNAPPGVHAGMLGFASLSTATGVHASVFYDRIELLGQTTPARLPRILANALAHEIGHVLLRSGEHSPDGIMKALWGRAEFQYVAARFLGFTALQGELMRVEALRRLARSSYARRSSPCGLEPSGSCP